MPRPRGGDWLRDEIESFKISGVTDLVSMLTFAEETELDLQSEQQYCEELSLRFHRHPITDRGIPIQPDFDEFIDSLLPLLKQGKFIAIHCRAGIGRASVSAAALLCGLGMTASEAMALISRARGFEIPDTEEQRDFIIQFDQRTR
jgi:protein-tyrosine phosphatase